MSLFGVHVPVSRVAGALSAMFATGCNSSPATSGGAHASSSEPRASTKAPARSYETLTLHAEGLTCEGCAWQIRETLGAVDGVTNVTADVESRRVDVSYDSSKTSPAHFQHALRTVGYETTVSER